MVDLSIAMLNYQRVNCKFHGNDIEKTMAFGSTSNSLYPSMKMLEIHVSSSDKVEKHHLFYTFQRVSVKGSKMKSQP